jgi:hypothetical protein
MSVNTSAYAWGQVFGVLSQVINNGLTPKEMEDGSMQPRTAFAMIMGKKAGQVTSDAHARIAELMQDVDPAQDRLSEEIQGEWWLGYYHESGGKYKKGEESAAQGRIDYSRVDWSKSNAILRRKLGVSRQAISQARQRHAPESKS